MAEVILKNVTKIYPGGVEAVKDFNLRIHDEEFLVLVGPSGCGKSTTLRMVAGLEQITSGTMSIGDRVINNVPPKKRDIAMVFQNYALYPHMTVYKNLAFSLKLRGIRKKEIDTQVRRAAEILGISELLDRRPKALSGGQRQRVALGRAIVRDPKAFLFDEPLSNLDAKLRVEMRAELKRLHSRLKTTTLYVTHDQEEAMTLGDRVVVMKDGIVQQCDSPLEVYGNPSNRFVAGFVGTPSMNFFEGPLVRDGDGLWFDEGSAKIRLPDDLAASLADWVDREVVFGVRPEGMNITPEGRFAGRGNVLSVSIDVLEPLGEKIALFCSTPKNDHLVARVEAVRGLEAGQTVDLHLDMKKIHVFEPGENGKTLSLRDENLHFRK